MSGSSAKRPDSIEDPGSRRPPGYDPWRPASGPSWRSLRGRRSANRLDVRAGKVRIRTPRQIGAFPRPRSRYAWKGGGECCNAKEETQHSRQGCVAKEVDRRWNVAAGQRPVSRLHVHRTTYMVPGGAEPAWERRRTQRRLPRCVHATFPSTAPPRVSRAFDRPSLPAAFHERARAIPGTTWPESFPPFGTRHPRSSR